jgi:RNA polymerase sigma factor (sigma-70 family)
MPKFTWNDSNTGMKKRTPQRYTNEEYLRGLHDKDPRVARSIYQEYLPGIIRHVKKNSGTREDGEDLFQEALLAICLRLRRKELKLTCAFYTYLFEICRRLWLNKLRKRKKQKGVTFSDDELFKYTEDIVEDLTGLERERLYREKLKMIGEVCRNLLALVIFERRSMKEVADLMNFKSEQVAKTKKYKCKQRLVKLVQEDPLFLELKP